MFRQTRLIGEVTASIGPVMAMAQIATAQMSLQYINSQTVFNDRAFYISRIFFLTRDARQHNGLEISVWEFEVITINMYNHTFQ